MKKRTVVASTLTASTLSAGIALMNQATKKFLYREHLDRDEENEWYKELDGEKIKIKNHKGMILQGYLFQKDNAKQTVIGLHALMKSSSSLKETIPYLQELFPEANVLVYDANAHGLSDGYIRGLGYRDVLDLMYFNTFVLQKFGDDHHIVMYGKGSGANTILNAAGLNKLKNVDLIISEGAYDNAYHYLSALCQKETKISRMVNAPVVRQIVKREIKMDIKKMNTVHLVKKNSIPTVYVHAKNDKDVEFKSVFPLYNHNQSNKFLFPIKEDHLYDLKDLTDSYSLSLKEFVDENI